jgi:hypothetical protein
MSFETVLSNWMTSPSGNQLKDISKRLVFCSLRCFGVLVLLLLWVGAANAQTPTGSVVGTVVDSQGLPIEGATVTLTNQGTNYTYSSQTGSSGGYQFLRIDYGLYQIRVSKDGFKAAVFTNIKLDAAMEYSAPPIKLEVGARTESITVEGGAEIVSTTSTDVGGTVEKKQIDDLPILDRHPLALLTLQAGVSNSGPTGFGATTTINGQRTSFSNLTLDGINIQDNFIRNNGLDFTPNFPFNSQAQEFTVITQNADVQEGNGSSQVSIVTPKGTNSLHGEGFWYYRTNAWAANNWFNDASGVPLPNLLQNQGGGNIGGPIKKDKLFFYAYYEFLRLRQQSPNNTTVLSPTILSALSGANPTLPFTYQPFDNTTGQPVGPPVTVDLFKVENQFDPVNFPVFKADPAMLALVKRIPTTPNNTRTGDAVNLLGYQLNARNNNTLDNVGARIDYDVNPQNTVTGTFSWNRQVTDRPDLDTSYDAIPLVQNDNNTKFLSTAWRFSPTASLTNEIRFGFNLAPGFFTTSQNFGAGYILDDSTLPFTDPNPNILPEGRNTRTWAAQDNASWVRRNHILKFGYQFQRVTAYLTNSGGIYPTYSLGFSSRNPYAPQQSYFPAPNNAAISQSALGNATGILQSIAGFIAQEQQTYNVTSQTSGYVNGAPDNRNYRQNQWAIYAGDSWRLTRKLTINYGLRWDYFGPVNEKDGLFLLPVIPNGQTPTQTMLSNATVDFAGGPSLRGLYNSDFKDFAPNIGLAWDPFGDGKTAVRAGFSINYVNDSFLSAADNASSFNAGLSTTPLLQGLFGPTVSNPMGMTAPPFGIPTDFATNAAILTVGGNIDYAIDPGLRAPQVQQWNLSVQRDIGWNTSLTISYVGNHGVGLLRDIDVNQLYFDKNGFLADFNRARSNIFLSLAASGGAVSDPLYNGPGGQPLTVFPLLFASGGIDSHNAFNSQFYSPNFVNLIYQGAIGALIERYHAQGWDTGNNPGPGPNNPINFFPNPYIMGGNIVKNTSFSTYNAGVVELRRRLSSGLYFQANYVFSKVMTDFGGSPSQFQPFQDNARPWLEKARAPFDITHAFKGNFTYELPIGNGHRLLSSSNRTVGSLVNGWQIGSIFIWQTGNPFSILTGGFESFNRGSLRSVANTAVATSTHEQISSQLGVFVQPNGVVYGINPSLIAPDGTGAPAQPQLSCVPVMKGGFCNPQPGQVGNLQLEAFSGPSYFNWDLSASKNFNLPEGFLLTFRTEAFNVLNHPTFTMFDQIINSTTFGQSTSTTSQPRILQMSLRLSF